MNFMVFTYRTIFLLILISPSYGQIRGKAEDPSEEKQNCIQGKHTRDIKRYEVIIPKKINEDGSFQTYSVNHFYNRDADRNRQKRRSVPTEDKVHYNLHFNGEDHHVKLSPNHEFISPGLVIEKHNGQNLHDNSKLSKLQDSQCHYKGLVIGQNESRAALSACNGLSGYIKVSRGHFFIEPALNSVPDEEGKQVHIIHQRSDKDDHENTSGGELQDNLLLSREKGESLEYERTGIDNAPHRKRSSGKHRYIESLVVADRKFIEYHNNSDVETYILTIMNIVSNYFHDASVGNLIDFTVVRIILLEKENEDFDIDISQNATKTLKSFCKWQNFINPPSHTHPNHHDIAILLTRQDLCSEEGNSTTSCSLVGSSNLGAACTTERACSINEDTGLVLGVTVTHELGHLLGCLDDPDAGCRNQAPDKTYHIMSPIMKLHTSRWSKCSRKSITEFLDGGSGECLLDEPVDHNFKYSGMLPGSMYDATFQCRMQFGDEATPCETESDSFCEALRCRVGTAKICWTKGDPAADGTLCGSDKWCYNEKCVDVGERPGAVDGDWGEWTEWSECSRTCGGGVSMQERDCDNPKPQNRGRYCLGLRKQYKICNTSPCNKTTSFRALQCSEFNNKTFNGIKHKWSVYRPKGDYDKCILLCINENHKHKQLSPRVKDGTSCRPGRHDMCIGGDCKQVGCDWVLGSDAVEDECGICKGDGTECALIKGIYPDKSSKQRRTRSTGFKKIATVPKGARNLKFQMLQANQNSTIAISSSDGVKFYLNGTDDDNEGEFQVGGCLGVFSYPAVDKREVVIAGPTKEDLILYSMQSKRDHSKVSYSYVKATTICTHKPTYNWEFLEWEECTARCGGGSEISEADCVEIIGGKVSNSFCKVSDRPQPKSRVCNERPCTMYWKAGPWSSCDHSTYQFRNVTCMKETPHASEEDTEESPESCKLKKPEDKRACIQYRPKRTSTLGNDEIDEQELEPARNASSKSMLIVSPHRLTIDLESCNEEKTTEKASCSSVCPGTNKMNKIENIEEEPSEEETFTTTTSSTTTTDSYGEEVEIDDSKHNNTQCNTTAEVKCEKPRVNKAEKMVNELLSKEDANEKELKRPPPKKTKYDPCRPREWEDHIYPDEIQLIGVPIADKSRTSNCKPAQAYDIHLSDEGNAEMGDRIPNTRLNFEGEKRYHGEAALEKLGVIEHKPYCRRSKFRHH